jgi:putative PIN family toxin of toxin-antitoxin system
MESTPNPRPWRIVLDTASLISGLRSERGAARELFRLILEQKLKMVLDLKLLLEYHAVALRPHQLQASQLSLDEMLRFLRVLTGEAEQVEAVRTLRPFSFDPDDDMIVELAVTASADAIVTTNVRHFASVTESFGILVLTPGELVVRLKGGGHIV